MSAIPQLQGALGNQRAQQLLKSSDEGLSAAGRQEAEADTVAKAITRGQRVKVRSFENGPSMQLGFGAGRPLSEGDRRFFESRLGVDLGRVRVHDDATTAGRAASMGARAFTIGQDIGFASGQYRPGTRAGRWIVAHELAHTLQQRGGSAVLRRTPDKSVALAQPWTTDGVKAMLAMTTEGREALASFENKEVEITLCSAIEATQYDIVVKDPGGTMTADEVRQKVASGTLSPVSNTPTDVPSPTFNGHSNASAKKVWIKESLSNLDASATLIHEWMHVMKKVAGESPKEEEERIRTSVTALRAGIETSLGFTEEEKKKTELPPTNLTAKEREARIASSQHYKPSKTHVGGDEYKVTLFGPRPIEIGRFAGFDPP